MKIYVPVDYFSKCLFPQIFVKLTNNNKLIMIWLKMHNKCSDNDVCKENSFSNKTLTATETQMYRMDFWTVRERERVGWFGRMALKHVNESPVYVQYRIQDAWGWCMGMIQRDDMGWEVGDGFRIGNSCTPMVDSCQCMAKPIKYCKVK